MVRFPKQHENSENISLSLSMSLCLSLSSQLGCVSQSKWGANKQTLLSFFLSINWNIWTCPTNNNSFLYINDSFYTRLKYSELADWNSSACQWERFALNKCIIGKAVVQLVPLIKGTGPVLNKSLLCKHIPVTQELFTLYTPTQTMGRLRAGSYSFNMVSKQV